MPEVVYNGLARSGNRPVATVEPDQSVVSTAPVEYDKAKPSVLKEYLDNGYDSVAALLCAVGMGVGAGVQAGTNRFFRSATVPAFDGTFVSDTYQVDDETYHFYTPVLNVSGAIDIGYLTMSAAIAWAVIAMVEIALRWQKLIKVSDGMNLFRWLSNSLLDPLVAVALTTLLWNVNTFQLFTTFLLFHVCSIGGLYLEATNSPSRVKDYKKETDDDGLSWYRTSATLWPNVFTTWIGLLTFVIPIVTVSLNSDRGSVSSVVYAAAAMFILQAIVNYVIQTAYYAYVQMPDNGFMLFKAGRTNSSKNYISYNRMLTWSTTLFRILTLSLMISALSERKHQVYPDTVRSECTYAICAPTAVQDTAIKAYPYPARPQGRALLEDQLSPPDGPHLRRMQRATDSASASASSSASATGSATRTATPSPLPVKAHTFKIPAVCARAARSMEIISPSGYNNVDASVNAPAGTSLYPGSSSTLTANFYTACTPNFEMLSHSFIAMGYDGAVHPAGTFNLSACCDPSNFDPMVGLGCYGVAFTSTSTSSVGVALETNTFGAALLDKNQNIFVVGATGQTGFIYSNTSGFEAKFSYVTEFVNSTPGLAPTVPRQLAYSHSRASPSARPHKPHSDGQTSIRIPVRW